MSKVVIEEDYVLGINNSEVSRLGLQHRVWRPQVLKVWRSAGFKENSHIIDIGAGPGHATVDLAEIVGPSGKVVAIERSQEFIDFGLSECLSRNLKNVQYQKCDLVLEPINQKDMDGLWCRWVLSFVNDPEKVTNKIVKSLKLGGCAVFHEYAAYGTWRLSPHKPSIDVLVQEIMRSWRDNGGNPDIGLSLPKILTQSGMVIKDTKPIVFTVTQADYAWSWLSSFIESSLERLQQLGRIEKVFVENAKREFYEAERDPNSIMISPLLLEIVAVRRE